MALDSYASDEERAEAIKRWWRESARAVLLGIIIGLLGLFGIRSWMKYKQNRVIEASSLYQQVITAKAQKGDTDIYPTAEHLVQDYGDTSYGLFSALILAKEEQLRGDLKAATSYLKWALDHTKDLEFQQLIYLRLARLLLAEDNPQEALTALTKIEPGSFSSVYAELRGDAYIKLGQLSKAQLAYQEALLQLVPREQRRQILQMKLDNIISPNLDEKHDSLEDS
jgi:predicted negative regulator of RcsB-dependent stress response